MAGLDPSVIGNLQTPQATSLGDMVNLARGAQAYQQAQQVNPIAVQQAQTQLQQTKQNLNVSQEDYARRLIGGVANMPELKPNDKGEYNPDAWKATVKMLRNSAEAANLPQHPSNLLGQVEDAVNSDDYKTASKLLGFAGSSAGSTSEQYQANLPKTYTNTAGQVINVKPLQGTAEVIGQAGVPANLTMGEVNQFNKDLEQTRQDNASAQPKIATLQTIKNLSKDAFTGVGGGVKAFTAGLAQSLGIPAYVLETANTQELAKNSAILQLAGGNTDLSLRIAEIANPHSGMNQKAINDVVNQLSGIERMKQARAQYLLQEQNNPVKYNEKSQRFNAVSDPRIFQNLTSEEAQEQASRMSASEKKELLSKIRMARLMGVIPGASQQSQQTPVEIPR